MIRALKEKMIEMRTLELQITGQDEEHASTMATEDVERFANLFDRALASTGMTLTYDTPTRGLKFPATPDRGTTTLHTTTPADPAAATWYSSTGVTDPTDPQNLRAWRLDPGTFAKDLQAAAEKMIGRPVLATLPEHTHEATTCGCDPIADLLAEEGRPVPPEDDAPTPDLCGKVHAGKDFDWCLSDHLNMLENAMRYGHRKLYPLVDYPEVLARDAFAQYKPQPADEPGPTLPVDDMPAGMLPGHSRQDLEDKLRIIAAIVDQQAPLGTELADFKRRLQRML